MLILKRKVGESVVIDDHIEVQVISIEGVSEAWFFRTTTHPDTSERIGGKHSSGKSEGRQSKADQAKLLQLLHKSIHKDRD